MNMVTPSLVREKLLAYLNRSLTLSELVDWAEDMMMVGEFEEEHIETLTAILARLGVADVREFGLSWDDCYDLLKQLGYRAQVTALTW
jgi:hypothetical protein